MDGGLVTRDKPPQGPGLGRRAAERREPVHAMRAFVAARAGAAVVGPVEVAIPEIGDDELLVRVRAFGVGIHDASFLPMDSEHPYPIGIEGAGVVEDVGGRVEAHQPGDRIAFVSSMQRKGWTWAELAAVTADALIVKIPTGMGFVEAAAVPVAGSTVLRTMAALAGVPTGAAVFIAGGSGAIGTLAVQVARRRGYGGRA